LQNLLDKLALVESDQIWLTGDLVNRGPKSLETLRFVKALGHRVIAVLGNHDLHLLALNEGRFHDKPNPTLQPILNAEDRDELLDWLRQLPLFHHDTELGWALVHAGIHPHWDLPLTRTLAAEVEALLRGEHHSDFLQHMYGNRPDNWDPDLSGDDRARFVINVMTRMRFCYGDGRLDFLHKGPPGSQGDALLPWYEVQRSVPFAAKTVFGHWSALGLGGQGQYQGIDTGCLWGGQLTAIRLDSAEVSSCSVECPRIEKQVAR
jgi:bis(5'-nucleosyl)-tetraphosphatase (symmetrical)